MANTGYAWLCFFALLAACAHCGLGSRVLDDQKHVWPCAHCGLDSRVLDDQIGYVWLHNEADGDMLYRSTYYYDDGTSKTEAWVDFPGGAADQDGPVWSTENCIHIEFQRASPSGVVTQTVPVWCKSQAMPIDCLPNCHWQINDSGFSVASNHNQYPVWVYGWNGP